MLRLNARDRGKLKELTKYLTITVTLKDRDALKAVASKPIKINYNDVHRS